MSKIYVIHHDTENYPAFSSDVVTPILAGRSETMGQRIPLKDDSGDCRKDETSRDLYSEFTALYWVWKNRKQDPKDFVGFMHYRSFLDISNPKDRELCRSFETRFGYTEDVIKRKMADMPCVDTEGDCVSGRHGVDIVTSPPLSFGAQSLYEQFDSCHPLANKLFEESRKLISESSEYKGMADFFNTHFKTPSGFGFFKCLFISTWEYFDSYCRFIFYMLDGLYDRLKGDIGKLDMIKGPDKASTQKHNAFRLLAFMGERLTSFFIAYSIHSDRFCVGTADRCHYESMSDYMKSVYPPISDRHGRELTIMMRAYSMKRQDHMALTDLKELDSMKKAGYFLDGPLGYIYSGEHPSLAVSPVYRYVSGDQHVCVKDPNSLHGYTKEGILGYSMDFPGVEHLHLMEYCGVGLPYGSVTSIDPGEFPHVGYDPNNPYMDPMADLGYLHSGNFKNKNNQD